jgi:phosphoribosylamine-glycine ligase
MKKNKKKILILGSNLYQQNLAQELINKKYNISILSNTKIAKKIKIEKFYKIDVKNHRKILNIFKKERFEKIISTGSDVMLKTIGLINSKLNLKGLKIRDSKIVTNKIIMKNFMIKNKILTPKFKIFKILDNDGLNNFQLPVILKNIALSGSRKIQKIYNKIELKKKLNKIKDPKNYIFENLISGKEFGANIIFQNKCIIQTFIFDDILFDNGKTNVPIGHIFPAYNLIKFKQKINIISQKIINNLNLKNGFLNLDFIVEEKTNQLYLIEFSTRLGATGIPELYRYYFDYNIFELIACIDSGKKNLLHQNKKLKKDFFVSILAIGKKNGYLKKIDVAKNYKKNCVFKSFLPINSKVSKFNTGNDGLGYAIFNLKKINLSNKNFFSIHIK